MMAPLSLAQLLRQYIWAWVIIVPVCSCVAGFCAQLGYACLGCIVGLRQFMHCPIPMTGVFCHSYVLHRGSS